MAASIKIPATFTARDKFSPAVKRMSMNVQSFSNKASVGIARVEHRFNRLMRPISRVNRMLGGFGAEIGIFGAAMVVGNAISIFSDFEQANANVASVLGTTISQTRDLQEDAKRLGATTAFTASEVAGLQTEYAKLGFAQKDILNATEATLSLAAAAKTDLSNAAAVAGGTLSGFGYETTETQRVVDVMAKSFSASALDIEKFSESMKYVAPVASNINMEIEETTAALGVLANSQIQGSQAGTALKRILNEVGKSGKTLSQYLEDASKGGLDLAEAEQLVGKNAQTALIVLAKNQQRLKELDSTFQGAGGAAKEMADKQLDTLQGSLTKLQSAYEGFILSLEDGNGVFGVFIRRVIDVTTEILSLLSGTALAREELDEAGKSIRDTAQTTLFWLKGLGLLIASVIAFKTILLVSKVALAAYNVVMGISTAITQKNKRALISNTVAQGAYRVAMIAGTAATWLANSAFVTMAISVLAATWPILAIIAAVVAVIAIFKNWDAIVAWFKEKFYQSVIFISDTWASLVKWFENFSFTDFFAEIGASILKFMLWPLKGVLKLIDMIPGKKIGLVQDGLKFLEGIEKGIDSSLGVNQNAEVLPTTTQASNQQVSENISNSNVNLNIRDKGNNVESVDQDGDPLPINLGNSIGSFAM